jgi:predicted ribosomally synthesized peptide with nif11-like leader
MSKENLDQFIQKVTDDEQLQARIGDEIDADSLIALGAEHGCEFTAEDLVANAELSDEELDGVAGGLNGWHIEMFTGKAVKGDVKFRIGERTTQFIYKNGSMSACN